MLGEREEDEEQVLANKKTTNWDSEQVGLAMVCRHGRKNDFLAGIQGAWFAKAAKRVARVYCERGVSVGGEIAPRGLCDLVQAVLRTQASAVGGTAS